jgi:hypothetical protein
MATPVSILISIGGVTKTTLCRDVSYTKVLGATGTASFKVSDPTGAYIPTDGDQVQIIVGGVVDWLGEVVAQPVGYYNINSGVDVDVTAHDYNARPAREQFNGIIPSQTLKATLQQFTAPGAALHNQGITLAAGQVTGPTLGAITCVFWDIETLLNHLRKLTGYVWWVNPSAELEMWLPGAKSSGVTLSLANGNLVDCTWDRHRFEYRNIQGVVYGPTGDRQVSQTWTGTGAATSYATGYNNVVTPPGSVTINPGGTTLPVGVFGVDTMEWTWDTALAPYGGLRHTGTPLTGSQTVTANNITVNGPIYYVEVDGAEVAARGRWQKTESAPEILTLEEATALAQALIRQNKPRPKIPTAVTTATGIDPGETVVVSLSEIGISETVFAAELSTTLEKSEDQVVPTTTIKAFGGTELQATTAELWQRIVTGGDSTGSGGISSSSGGGGGGGGGTTTISGGIVRLHFGGWKQIEPPTWRSVAGNGGAFDLPEGAEYALVAEQVAGSILLRIHLATDGGANGTVSARLFNETTAAAASDWTAGVTATGLTYVSVVCTLAPGENVYKVQLRVSGSAHATANVSYWNATLENRT